MTGKEIHRLSWPHGTCTNDNYELKLLQASVAGSLNHQYTKPEGDLHGYTYTEQGCRTACLQRLIWQECRCLDLKSRNLFDYINGSMICGALGSADMDKFLENYAEYRYKLKCFDDISKLISKECTIFHKMIEDLACAKKVKEKYTERRISGQSQCHCPPACHIYEYEVSVTQSAWPAPGPEAHSAYLQLISDDLYARGFRFV